MDEYDKTEKAAKRNIERTRRAGGVSSRLDGAVADVRRCRDSAIGTLTVSKANKSEKSGTCLGNASTVAHEEIGTSNSVELFKLVRVHGGDVDNVSP
jgi:hypothetical protein